MQKRTSRPGRIGRKWLSPIQMSSHPQCPCCGVTLDAGTWAVNRGDAECQACARERSPKCYDSVALQQLARLGLVTTVHHGIRFFVAVNEPCQNVAIAVLLPEIEHAFDYVTQAHQRSSELRGSPTNP